LSFSPSARPTRRVSFSSTREMEVGSEAESYATSAAEKVKEIQSEAEDLLIQIQRATEIESRHIEDQRLELLRKHAEKMEELQGEIQHCRDLADEKVHKIESEMRHEHAAFEEEVLAKSVERKEALKLIKQEVDEASALADEEYRTSLEKEKQLHAEAKRMILEMDQRRCEKVQEIEENCQLWITSFNQRLEETQADLAYRLEHLVGEAQAVRYRLHQTRESMDRRWEEELEGLRHEALQDRFEAASSLDQARLKRRELEGISKEKSLAGIEECQEMKRQHIVSLRRIADDLDQMRRNIALQARDPMLVQSLTELAVKIRLGQMKQQPPKLLEV